MYVALTYIPGGGLLTGFAMRSEKERKKTGNPREGWEDGTPPPHRKERKKTYNPREGWEDGTPPPHRDFKERCVMR